jgi:hypothetical protein
MIKGRPRFDVLNFTVQNKDFAQFRMPEKTNLTKRTSTTYDWNKPFQRNANPLIKVSDSVLFTAHIVRRIISSYPCFDLQVCLED